MVLKKSVPLTLIFEREGVKDTKYRVLNPRPQHPSLSGVTHSLYRESCENILLFNNIANLLFRLVTCCKKILGTRPKMTENRRKFVLFGAFLYS